jgi:phosphatidate cytidylyltransferase
MLAKRWATALTLLAGFLACLFWLPEPAWTLVLLLPLVLGAREWGALSGFKPLGSVVFALGSALLGAAMYVWGGPYHALVYLAATAFWVLLAPLWLVFGWRLDNILIRIVSGWLILLPLVLAMLDLRAYSPVVLLLLMGVVWIGDSAAFFSGKRFGKRKLAPGISPGKTWEGVAGAWLAVTLYAAIILLVAESQGRAHAFADGWLPLALLAWLLLYLSILGDLFESWIKRLAGAKDSGTLLPGHGGLLDRIDALTSSLPVAALIVLHGNELYRVVQ